MRVALYLPVVTPWWFDHVIARLIRHLAAVAEVHVLVPPFWNFTGVHPEQLAPCLDLETVAWHIMDWDDHPALRTSAAGCPELLDLLHAIDPDYVLCRSADDEGARQFPGKVRFIMEAGFPPFPAGNEWIVLRDSPFDHGVMPDLSPGQRAMLRAGFDTAWDARHADFPAGRRAAQLESLGLPPDRPVIAVPLEYEHPENFFGSKRVAPSNADLVAGLAEVIDSGIFFAVTNHPLNERHSDNNILRAVIDDLPGRAKLVPETPARVRPTFDCAQACDGMIFENSKTISVAAFFGTPMARITPYPTGHWLNAEQDLGAFVEAVRSGAARGPDEDDARTWFAFHVANNVINLEHPEFDGRAILDMLEQPVGPARWETGLRRYAEAWPELFA